MNILKKTSGKMLAITQILAIALLAACGNVGATTLANNVAGTTTTTMSNICHATGDATNPYEEITLAKDIYPVPVNGCPVSAAVIDDGKITICHATNSEPNPYEEITVSANGLDGHGTHEGDIITSPETGCPASSAGASGNSSSKLAICHPADDPANGYEEITFKNSAELNDYAAQNPNDINPALADGCPAGPLTISNGKITICHATGSASNPYTEITVSVNGLNGHGEHEGDIFPASDDSCPASTPAINNDKITICHATGSKKHPYNQITISVNGLNGHNGHAGDIIPAPAGGCPTTK